MAELKVSLTLGSFSWTEKINFKLSSAFSYFNVFVGNLRADFWAKLFYILSFCFLFFKTAFNSSSNCMDLLSNISEGSCLALLWMSFLELYLREDFNVVLFVVSSLLLFLCLLKKAKWPNPIFFIAYFPCILPAFASLFADFCPY